MIYQTSKVRQGLGYLYLSRGAEFTGVYLTSLHSLLELVDVVVVLFPTDHNNKPELPGYLISCLRKPKLPGYLISCLRKPSFPLHVTTTERLKLSGKPNNAFCTKHNQIPTH